MRTAPVAREAVSKPAFARVNAELFAAGPDDPRSRRPSDALRAVAEAFVLLLAAVISVIGHDLDEQLSRVMLNFPGFLRVVWLSAFWGATAWAVTLLVITLVRHRPRLTAEAALASVVAIAVSAAVAVAIGKSAGDVFTRMGDIDGPPLFPPALLAITSAVLATMAPRLTLPFRRVGRVFIAAQLVSALFLGTSLASAAVAAIAIGLLAGTAMHLAFGSPGGFPTIGRVRSALQDLGVHVDDLRAVSMGRDGVAVYEGVDGEERLRIKVYGRDAWDAEFVASVWRQMWYRGAQRSARLSRLEYVEHEGFMTFLAERAGAHAPEVVTAGSGDNGDALIALRAQGTTLVGDDAVLHADELDALWGQLHKLHGSGITHRRIDLDRVVKPAADVPKFGDFSSASAQSRPADLVADDVQLLALALVTSGEDVAIVAARRALGDDRLRDALPYVQDAVLPPLVRSALRRRHISLDAVRKRLSTEIAAPEFELTKLRRVTWKSVLSLALLVVAAYSLIGMLAGIDLDSFARSLRDADWWWLAAALLVGQLPRVANAVSTQGSTTQDLPLGPTTLMQFASCYVNLAVPSSAGRVALTTRFYQRFGVPPASALTAGVVDSVSEFIVQGLLFLLVFFVSDVDLHLSFNEAQLSGLATTALVVLVVALVALATALLIRPLRARLLTSLRQAREALQVLRSPIKLVELFGGNLLSQLLFAVTLGACVHAFGFHLPLSTLILINTVVTLFAGLLPVPGGVGVSEGGLTLGLTRAGVPASVAVAIALSYRFVVFYLPPLWGYVSFKWLTARRYL